MFTSDEQVRTFVDLQEKFTKAIINHSVGSSDAQTAAALNKYREGFEAFIKLISGITVASDTQPEELLCPECNYKMALRTNRTNGNKFWGCKKYPNCKGTRDENGLSKADRDEKKQRDEQVQQDSGFSFNRDKRNPVTEVSPPVNTGWVNPFAKG